MNVQQEFPKLILHFDVNKTIILKDAVTSKTAEYNIINSLAERTIFRWNPHFPKMSYSKYVDTYMAHGSKHDQKVKQKRQKLKSEFLEMIKKIRHPISQEVQKKYEECIAKKTDSIFPSFIKLIAKLQEMNADFLLIIRTFGSDLKEVQEEIQKTTGLALNQQGQFKEHVLYIDNEYDTVHAKTDDIFRHFLESNEHIAIQDDYKYWNKNGEESRFGKPFIFDLEDKEHLSLFFDDNISEDIVAPLTKEGDFIEPENLTSKNLFQVDMIEALLDEDYYIHLIDKALCAHGYATNLLTNSAESTTV